MFLKTSDLIHPANTVFDLEVEDSEQERPGARRLVGGPSQVHLLGQGESVMSEQKSVQQRPRVLDDNPISCLAACATGPRPLLAARSFWVRVRGTAVLTAIMVAWLWSCPLAEPAAAQDARKRSYNFSAGHAGDVLSLDPKLWTDINRFVFLVGGDIYPPRDTDAPWGNRFGGIEGYPKLRKACRQWEAHTFWTLQQLAEQLSTGEIQELIGKLEAAVTLRPRDPNAARAAFDAAARQLTLELEAWDKLTKAVKQDLESLASLSLAADIQLQGAIAALPSGSRSREVLERSRPRLKSAVVALTAISDQWTAISSDLAFLQREMDTNLGSKDEFILSVTIDVGRASWTKVQTAARSFVTNVPMQRKYLTGENYYDESPVQEGRSYLLENRLNSGWPTIGGLPGDNTGVRIQLVKGWDKGMPLMFHKAGGGWWRIVTSAIPTGDGNHGLTAGSGNPPSETCFSGDTSVYFRVAKSQTDLFWRFVPSKEEGWFYLVNYSVGEFSALTVDNYRCGGARRPIGEISVIVRDFANTAKTSPDVQYWRVVNYMSKPPWHY